MPIYVKQQTSKNEKKSKDLLLGVTEEKFILIKETIDNSQKTKIGMTPIVPNTRAQKKSANQYECKSEKAVVTVFHADLALMWEQNSLVGINILSQMGMRAG